MPLSAKKRVCDRCIRKKVKCDLQRPCCSRCSEAGLPCTYSAERKKPGPPRGSRRQRHAASPSIGSASTETPVTPNDQGAISMTLDQSCLAHVPDAIPPDTFQDFRIPQQEVQFGEFSLHNSLYDPVLTIARTGSHITYPGYSLSRDHERGLLVHFFDEVHSAIPLFRTEHFLKQFDDGLVEKTLLVAIVTVTARVLGPVSFWKPEDVELCMKFLLGTASPETAGNTDRSLESFRLECLLAYYEFHQFPGSSSWMRISRLARKAYRVGINQIENPELCSAVDFSTATEEDLEDWRHLFWCIYCLDSYSNITVGTPFVVELESINTSLATKPYNQADELLVSIPKVFLPDEVEDIWKTAKAVISNGIMINYNLHMVTTTILRQAGYLMRLRTEGKRLPTKTTALKGALAALRLALPHRYLNPARNALSGESCRDHHARLTNILHLHMAHLITALPPKLDGNDEEFMQNWLATLEPCQNIISVVEQWDNQHSPRIDPAICFIVYSALCFLEIHRWSTADPEIPIIAGLDQGQNLLLLFLEHFSSMWEVPRFLIRQFRKAQHRYKATRLACTEIDYLLSRFKTPLHPKALEHPLSTPATAPHINMDSDMTIQLDDLWSFDVHDLGL
ncbi:hypothetical protein F5B22DRAFT_631237 [Xylaria bambusicola]|uniref:uncharacterized protein n=1 Tax=Xylaria bambusicola TaxID=326684 RepID=UPI002007E467|nr:uncharacterized protein F5B22DRAFT_631237 [Xylaria bambusicola]KAI0502932.1 hypothetical protein F5B22DRAFT_631237 [Xylaria bambusicola]